MKQSDKDVVVSEDPRKTGLKNGLRQLNLEQLWRVWNHNGPMCLDTFNYEDGKFCPLAVALDLPSQIENPTHEKVYNKLVHLGYTVYNTRGIPGNFYTNNRLPDLIECVQEVINEKVGFRLLLGPKVATRWIVDKDGNIDGSYTYMSERVLLAEF